MRYRNAMQRDPNLAKAFDNLAGLFAPPSGADFAASANAQATNQKAARLAEIYNYAKDPSFNRELFERKAIAGGIYSPNQSFYSVDQGNATTLKQTGMNNATTLEQKRIEGQNALTLQNAKPVVASQDQFIFVPSQTQAATGFGPMLRGKMEFDANKTYLMPDGTTGAGPSMPSVDQATAAALNRQREAGRITDQEIVDLATPNNKTVEVENPITGKREIVSVGRAVREGMSPVPPAPTGGARKDGMAVLPDGRRAPVTRAPDGLQWQMQDGTPVPPEAQVFDMAKPTGTNDQLGITNSNRTDVNNLQAAVDGARFTVQNMRKILAENPNVAGIPGRVKGLLQSLSSSAQQTFKAYASEAPDAKITIEEARGLLDRLERSAGSYDPNIVRLQSGIMDLAYARAQISNPRGEVSRQAFERALESFGQTLLSSQQDLETGLAAFEQDSLGAADVKIQSLRRGSGGQPGAPAPPAGGSPPGQAVRVNTIEEAMALPSGTPFVTPDGRTKVRP
jgi:hypothetical protein